MMIRAQSPQPDAASVRRRFYIIVIITITVSGICWWRWPPDGGLTSASLGVASLCTALCIPSTMLLINAHIQAVRLAHALEPQSHATQALPRPLPPPTAAAAATVGAAAAAAVRRAHPADGADLRGGRVARADAARLRLGARARRHGARVLRGVCHLQLCGSTWLKVPSTRLRRRRPSASLGHLHSSGGSHAPQSAACPVPPRTALIWRGEGRCGQAAILSPLTCRLFALGCRAGALPRGVLWLGE